MLPFFMRRWVLRAKDSCIDHPLDMDQMIELHYSNLTATVAVDKLA